MYLLFLSSFLCKDTKKYLPKAGLLLTLPKQFPTEYEQIKFKENVTTPAKITIIYRLQSHIHANP